MKLSEKARCWTVRYTSPKTTTYHDGQVRTHEYNYCSVVIAENAQDAITELMSVYLHATIVSVNPGPSGQVIVVPETIVKTAV